MAIKSPDSIRGNGNFQSLEWVRIKNLRVVVPKHVVFRALPSETVLLNIQTGRYHGMDKTGSRFFEVLREGDDLQSALAALAKEYDAPEERIRRDLIDYCSELLSGGLIELRGPHT
jgi:hypothetical protein